MSKRWHVKCFLETCKNYKKTKTFNELPSDNILRNRWLESLNICPGRDFKNLLISNRLAYMIYLIDTKPPDKAVICNLHFENSSYKNTPSARKLLKCNTVPTLKCSNHVFIRQSNSW
jgi:hypothetical protein